MKAEANAGIEFRTSPRSMEKKLLTDGAGAYCAFPSIAEMGDEIYIAYKHGTAHYKDEGVARLLKIARDGKLHADVLAYALPGKNMQDVELLTMPDGTLKMYVDVQTPALAAKQREGARTLTWDGAQFVEEEGLLTDTDGTVYGYVFDGAEFGGAYRLLAMSFPELNDGAAREVKLLTLREDGRWDATLNLTAALGLDINESTLAFCGDRLYIAIRSYEKTENCHMMAFDGALRELSRLHYTEAAHGVGICGRPKLFVRDGEVYLLMRNIRAGKKMELILTKIDPTTLALTNGVLLHGELPYDGFYAEPYFDTIDGETFLRVVTYRGSAGKTPDIVLYSYRWDEVGGDG